MVKNPPANAEDIETQVRFLGQEDSLEENTATQSSIFARRNPMDRGPWQATFHKVAKSWT